jgi:hypothetical protein
VPSGRRCWPSCRRSSFSYNVATGTAYVPGDASATAQNLVANVGLVRAGVVADLIQATAWVFVAMVFSLLLRHVNENWARAMVILVAQVFYGLWLVPLGLLAYESRLFLKALGVLIVAGGARYLVGLLAVLLGPAFGEAVTTFMTLVPTAAEVWMLGYLLVIGVRSSPPPGRAPVAV